MVAIIDYGLGNLASVQKALSFLKIDNKITANHDEIKNSDFILLPGVGSFAHGMQNLKEKGLDVLLTDEVIGKKKKFLGICLGMQLIAETGTEPFVSPGLGWIKGTVNKIETTNLRIPHMGWNSIEAVNQSYLTEFNQKDFYFIHSYHFVPDNQGMVAAYVNYETNLVAAIQHDNIFATQFHPEKSQTAGLALLKNYFESC
jgi:glutamine amidotransferase